MPGAYDDEISADEQKLIDAQNEADKAVRDDAATGLIDGDDNSEETNAALVAEAEAADVKAKREATPPPAADPDAPPATEPPAAQSDEEALAALLEKHKDKSPAELAKILAQQGKRAAKAGFQTRRAAVDPQAAQAARAALAARKAGLTTRQSDFDTKLTEDPDEAARMLQRSLFEREQADIAREEAALEHQEHEAQMDEAVAFAERYIPNFSETYSEIRSFGDELGYSAEELNGIADGRDLVTLDLARIAGKMMKAGLIDRQGNFLKAPNPVAEQNTDPRLNAPAPPPTLSGTGRTGGVAKTIADQVAGAMSMSDADFENLSEAEVERMMRGG